MRGSLSRLGAGLASERRRGRRDGSVLRVTAARNVAPEPGPARSTRRWPPPRRRWGAGRTLDLEVRYENGGQATAVLDVTDDAQLVVRTASGGAVSAVDAWSTGVGMTTCSPAPVGQVSPRNSTADVAQVSLPPGGVLIEEVRWHAGAPERDGRTCGWNYAPLSPGAYRLSVSSPVRSNILDVQVVAPGPCQAMCLPAAGSIALPFATYPKLARVVESLRTTDPRYVDPVCGKSELLVAHAVDGIVVVSGACTDRCCPAEFDGSGFECPPCKDPPPQRPGSPPIDPASRVSYSVDGGVAGPVQAPSLPRLEVCEDECGVVVRLPARGTAGPRR